MIDYGKEPSNQSQLDTDELGAHLMREAHEWIDANPDAWDGYMTISKAESVFGKVSPNYVLQVMRHRYKVSVKNGLAPYLARIAKSLDDSLDFRLASSKADGFCEAVL